MMGVNGIMFLNVPISGTGTFLTSTSKSEILESVYSIEVWLSKPSESAA